MRTLLSGGTVWDGIDDLLNIQNEFNRVLERRGVAEPANWHPAVDAWTMEDRLVVDVDLPGVDPKTVDLSVVGDVLTLSGQRQLDGPDKNASIGRSERPTGSFTRTLQLPYAIESGKVTASYKNGVLRISLPRAEADKPQKIMIEAA